MSDDGQINKKADVKFDMESTPCDHLRRAFDNATANWFECKARAKTDGERRIMNNAFLETLKDIGTMATHAEDYELCKSLKQMIQSIEIRQYKPSYRKF